MKSLGIYHWAYDNRRATEASIASFRKYHPDVPYFLSCDGGSDHYDICKKYNVELLQSQHRIGYPAPHWGYDKKNLFLFLKRIMLACISMGTTHFVISEDDVHCLNEIQFDESWDMAAYATATDGACDWNRIPDEILERCQVFSGITPKIKHYGAGAGTIFSTKTYIENYYKVLQFYDRYYDDFHSRYAQLGWNDCFLHVFYYVAGKDYVVNPRLYNIWPENPNTDLEVLKKDYDMVHNFKNFYQGR